ncbi:MAG: OsmC family protein [Candidatus Methylomirabilales bacterium]
MAVTLRMYAQRKSWPVSRSVLHLDADQGRDLTISKIRVQVEVEGGLTDEQRARLKEIAGRCPIHRTLTAGIVVEET